MNRRIALKLGIVAALAAGIAAVYLSPLREQLTIANVRHTADLLAGLWYGPLVFIAMYAAGATFLVPASFFVVAAGVIWGWKLGFAYSMGGGLLGGFVSFTAARFLGEGAIERFGETAIRLASRLRDAGFKVLLIARVFVPFAIVNYGAGIARVRLRDFILATALGIAPATFVFAYSADALVNGTLTGRDAAFRVIGLAVLIAGFVLLPSLFKRRAARILEES